MGLIRHELLKVGITNSVVTVETRSAPPFSRANFQSPQKPSRARSAYAVIKDLQIRRNATFDPTTGDTPAHPPQRIRPS